MSCTHHTIFKVSCLQYLVTGGLAWLAVLSLFTNFYFHVRLICLWAVVLYLLRVVINGKSFQTQENIDNIVQTLIWYCQANNLSWAGVRCMISTEQLLTHTINNHQSFDNQVFADWLVVHTVTTESDNCHINIDIAKLSSSWQSNLVKLNWDSLIITVGPPTHPSRACYF